MHDPNKRVIILAVPRDCWPVALRLAGGDRRRIVVRPSPGAVGDAALLVLNQPRGRRS